MLSCETWAEAVAKVPETCPAPAGSGLLPAQIRAMAKLANIQISSPKHDLLFRISRKKGLTSDLDNGLFLCTCHCQ